MFLNQETIWTNDHTSLDDRYDDTCKKIEEETELSVLLIGLEPTYTQVIE